MPSNCSTNSLQPPAQIAHWCPYRVLVIGNFLLAPVGTRGVCAELAQRLRDSGCRVLTASPRRQRIARLLDMLHVCWSERKNYDVVQVDVYSGLSFLWAEAVCSLLRLLRKPYVLTLHGGNLPLFARQWPRRVRSLLRSANAVTAPSAYLLDQMRSYRAPLHLLPNALDLQAYTFRLRRRPQPHLMWLRAFHEIYNPALAVRILALLLKDFPDARLTMIGPDKGDGSLKNVDKLASQFGVRDRTVIRPGVPKCEVPPLLNEGEIFLNTARIDNTPVSVLEAMACGMCVVSTAVGGIPHLLKHRTDALLVPSGDARAMATSVIAILNNPDLAERLSRNARRTAEQFDWCAVLPLWKSLLTSVMSEVKGDVLEQPHRC